MNAMTKGLFTFQSRKKETHHNEKQDQFNISDLNLEEWLIVVRFPESSDRVGIYKYNK